MKQKLSARALQIADQCTCGDSIEYAWANLFDDVDKFVGAVGFGQCDSCGAARFMCAATTDRQLQSVRSFSEEVAQKMDLGPAVILNG